MEYVLYLRVSTLRQGQSGLGVEGQRLVAQRFLQPEDRIINEYIEVESGRKHNRPEIAKAIADTKRTGATLLVADMSRLARSVYFTSKLMEERVRFKACDMPTADEFTINIIAAVAQKGAKDISEATKRGLNAKKARGFTLGNPANFTAESRALGRAAVIQNAADSPAWKQARQLAGLLRKQGSTLAQIADNLNAHGYRTRYGSEHNKSSVRRLLLPTDKKPNA